MKPLVDRMREALALSSLTERQQELVDAAWEDCLDAVLEGEHPNIEPNSGVHAFSGATPASLAWIEAKGFRGIARGDTLRFAPGPGLTLVLGRNGSGKSSYVEALEVALRGRSSRWEKRTSKDWEQGWANVHHPADQPVRVRVGFHVDGQGEHVLQRTWADRSVSVDTSSEDFGTLSLDGLGWRDAVETTPPVLSYSELGRLADSKPSELYDALERLLGLEGIHAVRDRLDGARSANERPLRDLKKKGLPALLRVLANTEDERARRAEAALKGRKWDLNTLDELALGIGEDPDTATLRSLARLTAPAFDAGLAEDIRTARAAIEAHQGTQQATSERLAMLLDQALHWHAEVGDADSCPVCHGSAPLDGPWRVQAEERVAEARESGQALRTQRTQLQQLAEKAKRALSRMPPDALDQLAELDLPTELGETWQTWNAAAGGQPGTLADALDQHGPVLTAQVEQVRNLAASRLDALEEAFKPVRLQIAAFADQGRKAQTAHARVGDLKKAKEWVVALSDSLREERFAPISKRATQVWECLRQSSNVSLTSVSLTGAGNRRRLSLETHVDDTPATALGVMSQGEINALGLALFVPRALSEASPFRFLVIDDPVQAMDPHKVDGLALLLSELAEDRQVVVFTHDPRLREALDRMQLAVRVLEVQREPGSVVKVEEVASPVEQYLLDAFRVYKAEDHLGPAVVAGLVPAHCRSAVEAACSEVTRRRRIQAGHAHADVERLIVDTRGMTAQLALAFFDNPNATQKVMSRLKSIGGPQMITTLKATRQAHGKSTWSGSWPELVDATRKLTAAIRNAS